MRYKCYKINVDVRAGSIDRIAIADSFGRVVVVYRVEHSPSHERKRYAGTNFFLRSYNEGTVSFGFSNGNVQS